MAYPNQAEIRGMNSLMSNLQRRIAQAIKHQDVSVLVGYSASYAMVVHELPPSVAYHRPPRRWKYLEEPIRNGYTQKEIAQEIVNAINRKQTLATGLLRAGEKLKKISQKIVPVDTGFLRDSAYVRLDLGKQGTGV